MWPNVNRVLTPFSHAGLVVISPRARTVDFLDSLSDITARPEVVGNIFRFLSHHLGRDFLPSQWRMREGASAQQGGHELVSCKRCCHYHVNRPLIGIAIIDIRTDF